MSRNLLRFISTAFLLALFMFPQLSFAQLTGTKTIPGDYATISAAVADLNTQGVGPGGVTFNVTAGYTESITAPITITATGTAGNAIVFQKSGAGANPSITRTDAGTLSTSTIGGAGDAIIRIEGTDYITFNGIDVTAADQGIEYGYLTHKPDGTNGCQYVTIKNCVITMTKGTSGYVMGIYIGNGTTSTSSATGVTVTTASGINSNIVITGNTVQNVHAGIYVRGSSATGFYDSDVIVGQSGAGNIIQNFGGGNASTTYGVYFIYVNNTSVVYNTIDNAGGGGAAHGATLYGIFYSTVTGDIVGSNNAYTLANISASSSTYGSYNGNTCTSENFSNNTFASGTISSTGTMYLIYASSGTPNVTVSGNQVTGTFSRTGASGALYCYYNLGSPSSGTETFSNNNFSNISVAGSTSLYGYYSNTTTSQNRVCNGNTFANWTGGTGSAYIVYALSTLSNQIYNNSIHDVTAGGTVYCMYATGTNGTFYGNNIYNITTSGSTFYGLYDGASGTTNCYKNQVYNLTGNNASQTLYGFYISAGTSNNVFNNFISDLKAPSSASTTGLAGIYVSGGTAIGLYYNTIYLNASSTGTNFGSSGIYASTTPTVDLRNNIVDNISTAAGTGLTVSYRRSSTTLTTYAAASNNNDFYAGTPSATNLIYYDGTTAYQTLAAYKALVTPRDAAAFTENPPFINVATTPYNLHMSTTIPTQTEKGGTPVTTPVAITDDFDGNTRNATTPDVGADEFNGLILDLTPPVISYTPLLNTTSTSARTLTASVSDAASGVPTAGIGLPRLYWKKNYSGAWTGVTSTYLSGSNYQFSFGSGVAGGDTVYYYVVAQDGATTPNVIANPFAGAGGYTANPPTASTPPTSPYWYFIVTQGPLAGNYTVGLTDFNRITGKNIYFQKVVTKVMEEVEVPVPVVEQKYEKGKEPLSKDTKASVNPGTVKQLMQVEKISWVPMENGKPYEGDLYVKKAYNPQYNYPAGSDGIYSTITAAVADLNLRGVSAAVNFLLNDASYTTGETYPIVVNVNNVSLPTATNKVTIKPNTGVTSLIQGTSASSQIIKILTSYVNIDGSNSGGTDRSLTIQNLSTTTPQVIVIGSIGTTPVVGCSIKNCTIINGVNTSTAVIVSDGVAPGNSGYFSNITIQNNSIQLAYFALYCNAIAAAGNGSGLNITGNSINTVDPNAVLRGIYVQGVDGATVTNNDIENFNTSYSAYRYGIWLASGTVNSTVSNNTVANLNTSTSYYPYGITVTPAVTNANITVSNNTIHDFTSTSSGDALTGIYVGGASSGIKVQKNLIYHLYNTYSGGYGAWGIALSSTLTASNIEVSNNMIYDIMSYGYASILYENGIGIFLNSGGGYNIYYNSVYLYTNPTAGSSMCMYLTSSVSASSSLDIRNNIFQNDNTVNSNYCIYSGSANTVFTDINHNDYFPASPTNGYVGYLGSAQQTLAAWQTATGKDANSISADPKFMSNTNLHINTGYNIVDGQAQYLAAVLNDFDGDVRNVSTPDIGADEYIYIPPAVVDPSNVSAAAISSSQIDVEFTPNGNNNNVVIVFNLDGNFTTPTGAPPTPGQPFAGGTLLYNGLTSPLHHTGLTPTTLYYYKLFSYNGSLYSSGVTANATTPCGEITSFPWTEGFEGLTTVGSKILPECWGYENVVGTSGPTSSNTTGTYYGPHTGTTFIYTNYSNTTWIFTPGFSLNAGTSYDFSFWMMNKVVTTPVDFLMDVAYGADQSGAGMTNILASGIVCDNSTYTLFTYTFTPASSGTYYFGVKSTSSTSTPWYLSFDDFRFEPTPACPMPTGLTVTGITNVTANIGWSDATTVDIDYGTPGHPAGTGTVINTVTTNPYTITGLSAYTSYDVYVRQNCGSGSYSSWAGPLTFTTQINPLSVPYTQSFDASTFPPGWVQQGTEWSVSATSNAGGTPNEMHSLYSSLIGATRLIVGPINTTGMASLKLAFKQFFDDYGPGITVKIQSSADASTWADEAYSFASGGGNIGPETVNTTIANNVGSITYVAWVIDGDHYQYDNYYIDDVAVTLPLPNDVGTFSIDINPSIVPGSFAPQATVKNFGINTNSFNVQMNITGGYTSTKAVTNLAPGATQQVTFDNWNPALGQYVVKVFTQLGSDQDASNDTLYKNVGVYAGLYTSGSNYPTTTYLGSGVAVNGFLYSIGGNTTSGLGTECYKYNVATDTWTPIASLPSGRRVLATAAVGNFIYAIGGSDMSSVYQTTVYKYDIGLDTWTTVTALPSTIGWGKAVGYNNNYIYLAGGYDGVSTVLSSVYVYDVSANTWTAATSMPGSKFGGAFTVLGNTLVYAAGADDIDISSSVYVGTIDAGNPLLITWTTMAKPFPGISKTIHSEYHGKITEILKPKTISSNKSHSSIEASSYPPGNMYRFDAAPWGSDQIIVAAGSPTADWIPADPSPTYSYKPSNDTWTQHADVPIPVLGASLGSVNSGNIWKLVVASGLGDVANATQVLTENLSVTNTFQLSVSIQNGWNMVSVPGINPDGQGVNTWWSGHTGNVYKFVPGSGYNPVTTTTSGEGYWMKNVGNNVYNTGDEWPAGGIQIVPHNPISVAAKWNMFGGYEGTIDATSLTTTPSGQIVYPIYKFVPGQGYQTAPQIVPGYGYWVKVLSACQITVPDVFARSNAKTADFFKDDWGKIVLTDATGSSYTLYAVKGDSPNGGAGVDLDQYELPPSPPAGVFDVRYNSGRVAEDINNDFRTIAMSGVVYPVKVKAENMDIRLQDITGKEINTNIKAGEEITISNANIDKLMVSGQLIPDKYALEQNYPNPFNPSTTIEFSLPENVKNIKLSIYNILGQKVAELINTSLIAGKYQYQWDAKNYASGMYIYELRTEKFVSIKKMMLLK